MDTNDAGLPELKVVDGSFVGVNFVKPSECVFIHSADDPEAIICDKGELFIWTTAERAEEFIRRTSLSDAVISKIYTWDELIKFGRGKIITSVLIDHTGEEGFYESSPFI